MSLDPGAHSSTTPSTQHSGSAHAQDADYLAVGGGNISGSAEMGALHDPSAGTLDSWQENDDYREYFMKSKGCDGMLALDDDSEEAKY